MQTFYARIARLPRLLAWVVLVCFLTGLAAPAIQAAEKPAGGRVASTQEAGETAFDALDDDDRRRNDDDDDDRSSEDEDDDDLYYRVPRTDRSELNRTIATIVGGVGFGLIGMMAGGTLGFLIAAAIGGTVSYLIAEELFFDGYDVENPRYLSDPTYDRGYGYGSNVVPATGFSTAPDTEMRELEETYFEALEEYRRALRSGDFTRQGEARASYQEAYQAYVRGKAAVSGGFR
jgi:hypothetical protein